MIFFKDNVKLKSNDAENPALHQITKHSKRKQLFLIVIIFHNISVYLYFIKEMQLWLE